MILYFSGTGNSLAVAREIASHTSLAPREASPHDTSPGGEAIVDLTCCDILPTSTERIVWVFPVYSWGLPPIVAEFIARQRNLAGRAHWCVLTCGDDVGLADRQWRRTMTAAGATDLRGVWSVEMPNTYVCLPGFDVDTAAVAAAKQAVMPSRVAEICRAICADERVTDVVRGAMAWLKTVVLYPLFKRFLMSPRAFKATAACTACGLCSRTCPLGNITMASTPQWGCHCTLCLRCYHICPRHAIARAYTAGKGQKPVQLAKK